MATIGAVSSIVLWDRKHVAIAPLTFRAVRRFWALVVLLGLAHADASTALENRRNRYLNRQGKSHAGVGVRGVAANVAHAPAAEQRGHLLANGQGVRANCADGMPYAT